MNDKTEFQLRQEKEAHYFKSFLDRKVKAITNNGKEIIGKVVRRERDVKDMELFMLLPKGSRTRGFNITLGCFDGFQATITLKSLELI